MKSHAAFNDAARLTENKVFGCPHHKHDALATLAGLPHAEQTFARRIEVFFPGKPARKRVKGRNVPVNDSGPTAFRIHARNGNPRMVTPPAPLLLYMDGLREHDLDKIRRSFAPGLRFVTPLRSMDADETLRFLGALYAGFPDWRYDNDPPVLGTDGRWGVKWRQGGRHTDKLALPGFVEVEATHRVVAIPEHYFYYTVDEAGLKEIRPDPVPGGAPHGIFTQIGVDHSPL